MGELDPNEFDQNVIIRPKSIGLECDNWTGV